MALTPAQKSVLTAELETMTQRSNGHKAQAKALSFQMANLAKQLQAHEKGATDTDAAISAVQSVVNAG